MKQANTLTPAYAAVQASFWMTWCTSVSFAAVYLQGLGYRNAELGLVTAAGSLLGALLGPALSDKIDRDERVSAERLTPPVLAAQAAALLLLLLFPRKGAGTTLASCGIAYAMRYIRAAAEGGVELGFKADDAKRIVMQTVEGAVKLLEATGLHPEAAIDMVTTPGGVTIKGLNEMEHAGFTSAVIRGLKAGAK